MDITGIQNPISTDLLNKSPQAIVDAWKVGQLVNATAVTGQKNGQATVNINGALLSAMTQFPLKPGQPLQLEVSSLSALTVLKVIASSSGKPGGAPALTVSLPPQPQLMSQLQTGQQISAVLSRPTDISQTRTLLELAGSRISVQLSQPLPNNLSTHVKLEVVTPGAIPALNILTTAANPSQTNAVISQAWRSTLPQQAPLPPLLSNLALIAKDSSANPTSSVVHAAAQVGAPSASQQHAPPLPQSLIDLVRAVVDRLPRSETLTTGDGLKQAVTQSGLFMEARLAQALQQPTANTSSPPIDFKGGLLSLLLTLLNFSKATPSTPATHNAQQLAPHTQAHAHTGTQATLNQQMNFQQAISELLRTVESGLARLQLSQLISSAPEEDGKRSWVMELPVRTGEQIDVIQLKIKKENASSSKKRTIMWTVTLALDLSGLGPVQARITLADKVVSTHFWAEYDHTTELINQHIKILQKRFQEVGLSVGALTAHHGTAPDPVSPDTNMPHILLDEKV